MAKQNSRQRQLENLIRSVKSTILNKNIIKDEISIFLCGAGENKNNESVPRFDLGKTISDTAGTKFSYSVHYPEEVFLDLMFDYEKRNLLQLENFLAESVSCVVILLESQGAIAELGAFANHPELCKKLIVVVEPKYRNSRSFINLGPINHLKLINKHSIIYYDHYNQPLPKLADIIKSNAREIQSKLPIDTSLENPFHALKLIFTLVYLFQPLPSDHLKAFIFFEEESSNHTQKKLAFDTALSSLLNKSLLHWTRPGLVVDSEAFEEIFPTIGPWRRYSIHNWMMENRVRAVNLTLRKKGVGIASNF